MKYEVDFCSCGRIHIMPESELDWLQEDYKHREVIRVCTNCGDTTTTWLDEYDNGYAVNCTDVDTYKMTPHAISDAHMYADRGIIVYMMNGEQADTYLANIYANTECWKSSGMSLEDAKNKFLPWAIVDTERLIRDIKRFYEDDADDILKSISGYISGINWTGTEYANKWNCD